VMGGRSTREEHDAESDDERDARLHDESSLPCLVQPDDGSVKWPAAPRRPWQPSTLV